MKNTIALTMKEQKRVEVTERVFRGELKMAEAALVLGVSEHHRDRLKAEIREEGVKGVVQGMRRVSPARTLTTAPSTQALPLPC